MDTKLLRRGAIRTKALRPAGLSAVPQRAFYFAFLRIILIPRQYKAAVLLSQGEAIASVAEQVGRYTAHAGAVAQEERIQRPDCLSAKRNGARRHSYPNSPLGQGRPRHD